MIGSFSRSGFSTLTGPAPTAVRLETPGPDAQVCTKHPSLAIASVGQSVERSGIPITPLPVAAADVHWKCWVTRCQDQPLGPPSGGRPSHRDCKTGPRLRAMTWNVGGLSQDAWFFLLGFVSGFGLALQT